MYDAHKHHRHSIRLKGYDYTQSAVYFITIVTWQRECLFGEVANGVMRLNPAGEIACREWVRLAERFCDIDVSDFVVMPNHIHGIIVISDSGRTGTAMGESQRSRGTAMGAILARMEDSRRAPTITIERFGKPVAGSIPTMVRSYKSAVSYRLNLMRAAHSAAVWQRNYYEHIIRDEAEWGRIRAYIQTNPACWAADQLQPTAAPNLFNKDSR
jgi:REP element-mobilizing transposase RayT